MKLNTFTGTSLLVTLTAFAFAAVRHKEVIYPSFAKSANASDNFFLDEIHTSDGIGEAIYFRRMEDEEPEIENEEEEEMESQEENTYGDAEEQVEAEEEGQAQDENTYGEAEEEDGQAQDENAYGEAEEEDGQAQDKNSYGEAEAEEEGQLEDENAYEAAEEEDGQSQDENIYGDGEEMQQASYNYDGGSDVADSPYYGFQVAACAVATVGITALALAIRRKNNSSNVAFHKPSRPEMNADPSDSTAYSLA